MSNTARYRPTTLLQQLQRLSQEWDRFFELYPLEDGSLVETSHWAPCVDIKEEPNRFIIYADIPGVDPSDIEVSMEKGVLTIKGERSTIQKDKQAGYTRVERLQGCFYRRFSLPDTANAEKVTAQGNQGVLEIIIPKRQKPKTKKIKIAAKKERARS